MFGTSTAYKTLVLLHILSAVVAFGPWFLNGLFPQTALRRNQGEADAINTVNLRVSTLTQFAMYGVVVFGFGIIGAKAKHVDLGMGKPWVGSAIVVWLAIVGVLHGMVLPAQKKLANNEGDRTALTQRQSVGAAIIEVLIVVAVYLMVFKPGQ